MKGAQVAKQSGILGGAVWSQDPQGHGKNKGFLSAAKLPGFGVGKTATISEPRSKLSAWFCPKP